MIFLGVGMDIFWNCAFNNFAFICDCSISSLYLSTRYGLQIEQWIMCVINLQVGTSSVVYPAAGFAPLLAAKGVPVALFNMEETPCTGEFRYIIIFIRACPIFVIHGNYTVHNTCSCWRTILILLVYASGVWKIYRSPEAFLENCLLKRLESHNCKSDGIFCTNDAISWKKLHYQCMVKIKHTCTGPLCTGTVTQQPRNSK